MKWIAHFCFRSNGGNVRIDHILARKTTNLPHYWSDKGLKGTIENRTCPTFLLMLLKITKTFSLSVFFYNVRKYHYLIACCLIYIFFIYFRPIEQYLINAKLILILFLEFSWIILLVRSKREGGGAIFFLSLNICFWHKPD